MDPVAQVNAQALAKKNTWVLVFVFCLLGLLRLIALT
jgi:hypothetical protein